MRRRKPKTLTEKVMDKAEKPVIPPCKVFKSRKDSTKYKEKWDEEYE